MKKYKIFENKFYPQQVWVMISEEVFKSCFVDDVFDIHLFAFCLRLVGEKNVYISRTEKQRIFRTKQSYTSYEQRIEQLVKSGVILETVDDYKRKFYTLSDITNGTHVITIGSNYKQKLEILRRSEV